MPARTPASLAYVVAVAGVWLLALPAALIADAGGSALPLRGPGVVVAGVGLAGAGIALVDRGGRTLSRAGIGLFTSAPGSELVTTGVYGRVRNPMEVGIVMVSLAPWLVVDVALMWVIPAATAVWVVAGVGPYEDRRLVEEFDEDFRAYRASVRKWVPHIGR